MKKIESLTAEQIARFPEFVEKWTKIGLCTDRADRPRAEAAMTKAYAVAGLRPPQYVWCDSPASMALAKYAHDKLLEKGDSVCIGNSTRDSIWNSVNNTVSDYVRNSVRNSVSGSVRNSVSDSVRNSIRSSVLVSVWNSVWNSVSDSIWNSVNNIISDSVLNSVSDSVSDSVRNSVLNSVLNSVSDSIWNSASDSVRNSANNIVLGSVSGSVWKSAWNSVSDSVWNSVSDSVRNSVWDSVLDSVSDSIRNSVLISIWNSIFGQHDAHWLGFYDFLREVLGLEHETNKLIGLMEFAKSAGWATPHSKICWICERAELIFQDEQARLHCLTGPAIRYPDGWSIYAVHGVRVPEFVIMHPEEIPQHIAKETNAEVRRVMLDRYPGGLSRYLSDIGAIAVDVGEEDHPVPGLRGARLFVSEVPNDEKIVLLEMVNSTPEPDGTYKKYHIRVNPMAYDGRASKDVWAAMASTWRNADGTFFYETPEQYCPEIET